MELAGLRSRGQGLDFVAAGAWFRPGATFAQLESPKSMAMGRTSPPTASTRANDASVCLRHPEPAGKIDGWPGSTALGNRVFSLAFYGPGRAGPGWAAGNALLQPILPA